MGGPMKTITESRTVWTNALMMLLVWLWPSAAEFIKHNPEVATMALALINILLRLITRVPVSSSLLGLFICVLGLSSCATQYQKIDVGVFAKRNLEVWVDGQIYEGIGVLQEKQTYELTVKPEGESTLLMLKTNHRMMTFEKSKGWFASGKYRVTYTPVQGLETDRMSAIQLDSYDSAQGRHSWAFLVSHSKLYKLPFEMTCNGAVSSSVGTGICQSHHSLVQRLRFQEPVMIWPPKPSDCEMPRKVGLYYEVALNPDVCLYQAESKDGKLARIVLLGYSGALVEKGQ